MLSLAYGRVCQSSVNKVCGRLCEDHPCVLFVYPVHKKFIASMVECILTWIRELILCFLVVCNIAK